MIILYQSNLDRPSISPARAVIEMRFPITYIASMHFIQVVPAHFESNDIPIRLSARLLMQGPLLAFVLFCVSCRAGDAATNAMAVNDNVANDGTHSRSQLADVEDGDEHSADDGITVWYRYSAQLDDAWGCEQNEENTLASQDQRFGHDEDDLHNHKDLITAYDAYNEGLSGNELLLSQHTSPRNQPALSKYSLDGSGSGSGSGPSEPPKSVEPSLDLTFRIGIFPDSQPL